MIGTNVPRFVRNPPIDIEAVLVSITIGERLEEPEPIEWSAVHWMAVARATCRYTACHFGTPCAARCYS